jgi:hypothetical protein
MYYKAGRYGPLLASPSQSLHLQRGDSFDGEPRRSIYVSESVAPNQLGLGNSKCLFRIIGVDIFEQITMEDDIFVNTEDEIFIEMNGPESLILRTVSSEGTLCIMGVAFKDTGSLSRSAGLKDGVRLSLSINNISHLFGFTTLTFSRMLLLETSKNEVRFNVTFRLRNCTIGEYFSLELLECFPCKSNFYSFRRNFMSPSTCEICENKPFYCYGGANLTIKASYWRFSDISNNFLKCPNKKACLGDPENGPQISDGLLNLYDRAWAKGRCAIGYRGILCARCESHRGKTESMKCEPCDDSNFLILIIAQQLFKLMLFSYTIFNAFLLCKKLKGGKIDKGLVYSNYYLKIFIMHFQFLYTTIAFPLKFPDFLNDAFKIIVYPFSNSGNKSLSLECIFPYSEPSTTTYLKVLITLLTPIVVVSALKLGLGALKSVKICKKERTKSFFKKHRITVDIPSNTRRKVSLVSDFLIKHLDFGSLLLIVMMISFIDILRTFLEMFSYLNISTETEPEYRLLVDLEVEYYSISHSHWRSLFFFPVIIIIGLTMPLYILFKIYNAKRAKKLHNSSMLANYGYFYYAFKLEACLYEFIYFARKMFMIMLEIFIIKLLPYSQSYNGPLAASLLCMFLGYFSMFSQRLKPFDVKYAPLNKIDSRSLFVQTFTSFLVLCWIVLHPDYDTVDDSPFIRVLSNIYLVLGFSINLLFLGLWLVGFWQLSAKESAKDFLRDIKALYLKLKYRVKTGEYHIRTERIKKERERSRKLNIDAISKRFDDFSRSSPLHEGESMIRFQLHEVRFKNEGSLDFSSPEVDLRAPVINYTFPLKILK